MMSGESIVKTKRTALAVRAGSKKSAAAAVPGKATNRQLEQAPAPAHGDSLLDAEQLKLGKIGCEYSDTEDPEVGLELFQDICETFKIGAQSANPDRQAVCGMFMFRETEPKGILQSMLTIQLLAVHRAAMSCLRTAFSNTLRLDLSNTLIDQAVRLMHLFNEQLVTMERLKGKTGQQKVIVEHVNVNAGGQAIVGTIAAATVPRGGGGE